MNSLKTACAAVACTFAMALPASAQSLTISNDMPVITSDGVRVAEVNHVAGGTRAFGPEETFFTADPTYKLRRIYGREAFVEGGAVRLRMNAAEYKARNQNPD